MKLGVVAACHGHAGKDVAALLDPFAALVKASSPKSHIIPLTFAGPGHGGATAHRLSLQTALQTLADQGAEAVVIQPLYLVAGVEYQALARCLADLGAVPFPREKIALGAPLLDGARGVNETAAALAGEFACHRSPDTAVVLMGHGSKLEAQEAYVALARELSRLDPGLALATLKEPEDSPLSIQAVAARLARAGFRRAGLAPLTFAVGGHAKNDMAGDAPGSFAGVLARSGIECLPLLTGLCGRNAVLRLFVSRLARAAATLSQE